jgi:hypothetical protein
MQIEEKEHPKFALPAFQLTKNIFVMKKTLTFCGLLLTLFANAQNAFYFNSTNNNTRQDIGVTSGVLTFARLSGANLLWGDSIRVGIGLNAPTSTLHVQGKFRLVDGSQASNYVLTSDANGLATWTNPSLLGGGDKDWFTVGTTTAPQSITANKYTLGNIGIGTTNPGVNRLAVDSGMVYINGGVAASTLTSGTNFFTGGPGSGLQLQNESDYGGLVMSRNGSDDADFTLYFGDNPGGGGNDMRFCFAQWNGSVHQFNEYMRLTRGGNLGIGTNNPTEKLTVFNGTTTGTYTSSGWVHSSDGRLKSNVQSISNALEIVNKLNGVYYDWKNDKKAGRQVGFIAQDVRKILPEVVTGKEGSIEKGETLSMAYQNIVPILVEAIKEQTAKINEKDAAIDDLKKRIEKLELLLTKTSQETNPDFSLDQNQPNPFNSSTKISYSIDKPGVVSLNLYTADGQKIKTLENNFKEKGSYQYGLNGSGLKAGTYIYTLLLNGQQIAKKAIKL